MLRPKIFAKKTKIDGKLHLLFLWQNKDLITIEAINIESVMRIHKYHGNITDICEILKIPSKDWKNHTNNIFRGVLIENRKIRIKLLTLKE